MFADSLLESSWKTHSRRGWTTAASFAIQLLGVGTLLVLPMLYIEGLPSFHLSPAEILQVPAPPPPAPAPASVARHRSAGSANLTETVVAPRNIPASIPTIVDLGPQITSTVDTREAWNPDRSGSGAGSGVTGSAGDFVPAVAPPPVVQPRTPRPSVMMQGNLVDRIQPDYPAIARNAHIQGNVILHAVISRQGTIENLQLVSGHPLLVKAAMDAVKKWRYRPYMLNGEPVEVETQITVHFILSNS